MRSVEIGKRKPVDQMSEREKRVMRRRWLIDWLFTVLRPTREYFTHMETSPLPVKGWKYRPVLDTLGLWAVRDLYRATPAVTRGLGFFGLVLMTAPFSRLLRHARGCWGPILTRIPTGLFTWLLCRVQTWGSNSGLFLRMGYPAHLMQKTIINPLWSIYRHSMTLIK